MEPRRSRRALRWVLGVLSGILLGVSFYTVFSDAPANWTLAWPLMLSMAGCFLLLDRQARRLIVQQDGRNEVVD